MLRCSDRTLYTGYTTDVERRLLEHEQGRAAKYTRGRTPVELVHVETFPTMSKALSREAEIKGKTREEKLALVEARSKPDPAKLSP